MCKHVILSTNKILPRTDFHVSFSIHMLAPHISCGDSTEKRKRGEKGEGETLPPPPRERREQLGKGGRRNEGEGGRVNTPRQSHV